MQTPTPPAVTLVAGRERALEHRRIVRRFKVTDGEAIGDEIAGGRAGVREPERLEDQVANRRVDRRAGDVSMTRPATLKPALL
jgi:hypothetical protein